MEIEIEITFVMREAYIEITFVMREAYIEEREWKAAKGAKTAVKTNDSEESDSDDEETTKPVGQTIGKCVINLEDFHEGAIDEQPLVAPRVTAFGSYTLGSD